MRYRWAPLAVLLAAPAPSLASERVADPSRASVFIRVIGTVEVRVQDSWTETMEERNVELGTGSGFAFTPYGHVLTNYHVVDGGSIEERIGNQDVRMDLAVQRIEVMVPGPGPDAAPLRLPATVEVSSSDLDLAVLSVSGGELPYLALGDSDAAEPGEDVFVYGFPFGQEVEVGREAAVPDILPKVSVSRGAVAAARADDVGGTAFLQTTAVVNPGNSGGPMVDEEGFVLGVIRLKLRDADGIGFAVPVNSVKDFLETNGYGGLLPWERLHLGGEEALEGKGIALRLPQNVEDRSPSRTRAYSDPAEGPVHFALDRVATPWELARLEAALVSGEAFTTFQATGRRKSALSAGGRILVGSATGIDRSTGRESKLEYAILGAGVEKVVARYLGPSEAVAFNRSVLRESLQSLRVSSLLTAKIERPVDPAAIEWHAVSLPDPSAPTLALPAGWHEEVSPPFPCRGLPPPDSALSASAPGDFRVSLRAGFRRGGPRALEAARACSGRPAGHGPSSYLYRTGYLGTAYLVEGAFVAAGDGVLQLEAVSPEDASPFLAELTRAWIEQRRAGTDPK